MTKWERKALGHAFHGSGGGYLGADGPDKYAWMMKNAYAEMEADANKWATNLKAKLTEVGWDFNNLSESQKMSLALAITEMVSKADNATEDIRESVKKLASEKFGIKLDVKTLEAASRINALEQSLKDLVGHDWHIDIKTATNFGDVISKIRQDYKAAQDYFNNVKPLMIKMGVDVSGGMKELGLIQRTALFNQWKKENPGKDATIFENMLADYDSYAKKMNDAMGFNAATGISLSDPNSGGKTFRDKQPLKTDKELELWRKRIQLLEKYRQELAQLEKIMTRAQAESKLKSDGNFAPLWGYFSNPNDYNGSIDEAAKILGTKGDRKSFIEELGSKKGAEELRLFKEGVADAVSELERLLSVVNENYDTYKKWYDLTGDSSFAAKIAGVAENSSMASYLTDKMNGELKKSGISQSASDIFGMSESEVSKFGKNSAIFKIWDEWQKNNAKVKKQNLDLYAEAIKNAKGYAEKVADINRELEKEIAAIKEMTGGDTPTEDQQTQRNALIKNATETANKKIADETWNNFKATEEWGRIFADLDRVSTATLSRMLAKLREIAPTLNGSVESTKAVYEAIDKVQNVVNGRNPFKSISQSLSNRSALSGYYEQAKQKGNLVANAELSKLLGVKLGSTVTKDQIKDGMKNESEDFQKAIGKVVDGLQTFQNGLDLVGGVFDSLGMSGAANFAADASGILGGAMSGASALSSLGPWGMAAGAGLGLISGIAQTHDKALEREISGLREDVQKIENNTSLILQARERTLGFDTGDLRRSYMAQYAPDKTLAKKYLEQGNIGKAISVALNGGFDSEAQRAMYDYYKTNSTGTGYQQQYQNLLDERQNYMDMYNAEQDKKKSSDEALEEYKKKIAELDDQIRYFAEDIANELWGIDIKGWADQISDSLMTAFENGESAMKAFDEAAKSIMQSVVQEMLKIGIIEPMIERLRNRLFGYTDNQGNFHNGVVSTDELAQNPLDASKKMLAEMAEYFKPGGEGSNMAVAAQEYLTGVNRMMEQMGYSGGLRNKDSSNTLSASIQGIKEETADLLAGYVNAERQDVAVIRLILAQYLPMIAGEQIGEGGIASVGVTPTDNGGSSGEYLSGIMTQLGMMGVSFTEYHAAQLAMMTGVVEPRLSEIAASTKAIMESNAEIMAMMKEGRGAMFEKVGRIDDTLYNVTKGVEQFAVK
jgi:hypothetical protein